jgi:oxygen-independent coproporphyrinogen-3 oxidase
VSTETELKERYFYALQNEILNEDRIDKKNEIESIYIGGGTPSLMPLVHLESIIDLIQKKFTLSDEIEFSMEINPGTVSLEKFQEYIKLGLNRVSIGVQSFQKRELGIITRNHSPNSAIKAVENANAAGFDNISLDLMFSLPYQSIKTLQENLEVAIDLPINHISAYSLIYEEGTPLYEDWKKGKIKKHGEEFDAELYQKVIEFLIDNEFEQYEVSNFAIDKKYCKHNLSAWRNGEYFAFGVSANGYINGKRFANTKSLHKYLSKIENEQSALESIEIIDEKKNKEEEFFLGLRSKGVDLRNFAISNNFINLCESFIKEGFIKKKDNFISLTSKGYLLCDAITFKLLEKILHF